MAGGSIIGALRVVLGADTALLDKGLKDAQGSLARFGSSMKSAAGLGAAGLATALAGVGVAVTSALKDADKLGKFAQSWGEPVEELSRLKYAAELSDISLENLGTSMVRLSKNMSAVAGGASGPAADAFRALGIEVRNADGSMKSSSGVMSEVAGKFAGYEDGANKTALAVALFGKAGAAMIPMLNSGAAALEETKREADELGLIIDKRTAVAAENFNDNLTRLGKVAGGLWTQIAAQLAPELARLSGILVSVAKDGTSAKGAAEGIAGAFSKLIELGMTVSTMWQRLGVEWTAFRNFLQTDIFSGKVAENWNKFQEAGRETSRVMSELKAKFENDPVGNVDDALAALGKGIKTVNDNLREAPALASGAKNALQTFLDSQQKSIAARMLEAQHMDAQVGVAERLKLQQQAELIAMQNRIALTPQLTAKIAELGAAAEVAALKMKGAQLAQELMTPGDQVFERYNALQTMLAGGAVSQELYAKAMGQMWISSGQAVAGSFEDIAQSMGQMGIENKKMLKASQVFGAAMALISTMVGQAKALELPFPMNFAAMAAIAAKGFALVASIKSTSVGGFKTGGSFTVPGGMGGGDRMPVSFMAEPGEQVDIWRPGDGNNDPRGGARGGATELTINMQRRTMFRREEVEGLLESINELIGDGYKLKTSH